LAVVFGGAGACFSRQAHVLAVVAPTAPAANSLGVAFGVNAPLSIFAQILDLGAQAGAQTVACGDATPPQQERNTRQMSCGTFSSTEGDASPGRCPDFACGDLALLQQEKNTRLMSKGAE
jgi:hypothetical protein